MGPNQQQPEKSGDKAQSALILFTIISRYWLMFWTVPRTPGWRYVGSIQAVWSLGLLLLLAMLNQSTGLTILFVIALLVQAEHRMKRSENSHSYDIGRSRFTLWGINDTLGRFIEAAIAIGLGVALVEVDKPCGITLVLMGVGEAALIVFLSAKRTHQDQDLADSLHEQRARASRMGSSFGR